MKTQSWVIRNKLTKAVIMETFNEETAKIVSEKYEAVPILDYLIELNRTIQQQKAKS